MSHSQLDQLIHMANQIADNNQHHDSEAESVELIATHLMRFWARAMKQDIVAYANSDGSKLTPLAQKAVAELSAQYS